jgi:hypothetical protein
LALPHLGRAVLVLPSLSVTSCKTCKRNIKGHENQPSSPSPSRRPQGAETYRAHSRAEGGPATAYCQDQLNLSINAVLGDYRECGHFFRERRFIGRCFLSACAQVEHQPGAVAPLDRIRLRHDHGQQGRVLVSEMTHVRIIDMASDKPAHCAPRKDI